MIMFKSKCPKCGKENQSSDDCKRVCCPECHVIYRPLVLIRTSED